MLNSLIVYQKRLIPSYDSMGTLMSTFLAVFFAIILLYTRKSEVAELQALQDKTRETALAHIIDDEKRDESEIKSNASSNGDPKANATRRQSIRYAKSIIQDYHFKHNVLAGLSFIVLGLLSASTVTLLNTPFQVLFVIQASLSGYNWNDTLNYY